MMLLLLYVEEWKFDFSAFVGLFMVTFCGGDVCLAVMTVMVMMTE